MTRAMTPAQFAVYLRTPGTLPSLPNPLPRELTAVIGQMIIGDVRRRFQTSTDPQGRPWKPLKRPRKRGGNKPLLDTGMLRNSITSVPTATGVIVGSNLIYAAIHQFGGVVKPGRRRKRKKSKKKRGSPVIAPGRARSGGGARIPARPYLGVSAAAAKRIERAVMEYLAGRWGSNRG